MIERMENFVIPKNKLTTKACESDLELNNFKCRRMVEEYVKEYLPESTSLIIMWVDKDKMLSTAYCNVSPMKRLELYVVGFLQEIFDFKVSKKHAKE
jgi:hypothetical protein